MVHKLIQLIQTYPEKTITVICTIVMALATGFSAYYSGRLTILTENEWDIKQASIVSTVGIQWLHERGLFTFSLANLGSLPAKDVRSYSKAYMCSKEGVFPASWLNKNFFVPNSSNSSTIPSVLSGGVVTNPPGNKYIPFTVSETNAVKLGQKDYYFLTYVTYKDTKGNHKETRTCHALNVLTDIPLQWGSIDNCPIFNCSHEDCKIESIPTKDKDYEQQCSEFAPELKPFNLKVSPTQPLPSEKAIIRQKQQ